MTTIIRASDQNRAVQHSAFNFEDMAAQAAGYLDKIRAEAGRILAGARQQAEAIKKRAEAEGRAAGQQAVEQLVHKQLAQQLATLLPALRDATAQIRDAKHAWLAHWEKSAVHVAAAIAERIIRRELEQKPEITRQLVREALELAAGSSTVRIHLHPTDHECLAGQQDALSREIAGLASVQWLADPQISPGGCRVETQFGVIDQQVETQLARIEEELT